MSEKQQNATVRTVAVPAKLGAWSLLNMKQVCSLVGLGATSIRYRIKAGTFPAADIVDGPRYTRWKADTVQRWIASKLTKQAGAPTRPDSTARNVKASAAAQAKRKQRKEQQQ